MTEVPLGADPRLDGPVTLVAYSPQWPSQFEGEAKRIRSDPADRELYALAKRELAVRTWEYLQDYADAKSEVVAAITSRSLTSGSPVARRDE